MRFYFTAGRMAIIKKSTDRKCLQGWREKKLICVVGGNVNENNYCANYCGDSSKNLSEKFPLA